LLFRDSISNGFPDIDDAKTPDFYLEAIGRVDTYAAL
jgi:hypothetical protein